MTTPPADREFAVLERGEVRDDVILANWRAGLRDQVDPETGLPFSEEQIRRATAPRTRWHIEAQAIDDYAQAEQRRALFLSDQVRIERASTNWLANFHARLWGRQKLPATGGSGTVTVAATAGTIIAGSTTPGDPGAYVARDAAGNRYQVFQTVVTPSSGTATVTLAALSTGAATNPEAGATLTWISRDPSMQPTCEVAADFSGGTDLETDADQASRIASGIRYKEGAGNDAQMRAWARAASNAVEDAFVYPCAFNAGSVLVAITQKRGTSTGPEGRIPSTGTLASVIAYMTPPGSPVVPTPPFVLVTPAVAEATDLVLRLTLPRGSASGYDDATPFPAYHATTPAISAVASQTDFTLAAAGDATLPGQSALATLSGADAPQLMVWDEDSSAFVELNVASVEDLGSSSYRVQLASAPSVTLATGQVVSPDLSRRAVIAQAVAAYFDERGPGDLFDITADPRGARTVRFPSDTFPARAGSEVAVRVIAALGGVGSDATLASISKTAPSYPSDLSTGPRLLTLGKLAVYLL